jgi:uncharacterized protein
MTIVTRYDFIAIKAVVSPEGWIKDKPVLTRSGIFEYRDKTGKTIREYRSDEEVFKADSLNSLVGIPISDGHRGMLTSKNASGILGTVISPGEKQDSNVVAEIIIHDPNKLGARRELSLGYTADVSDVPGDFNGQHYDAIQTNIRYNHLAIVAKGRAGNARLRLDSAGDAASGQFTTEDEMTTDTKLVVIRLDEIEYQGSPEVARAMTKLQTDLVDFKKRFDTIEAERDGLKTKITEHETALKKVREDAQEFVRARLTLEDVAKQHEVPFVETDSDRSLREKIIVKMRGDKTLKFDGKSDDYVVSAYDLIVADDAEKNKKVGNQRQKMDNKELPKQPDQMRGAGHSRNRMLGRIYNPTEKTAA